MTQAESLELFVNALFNEIFDPFPLIVWSEAAQAVVDDTIHGLTHIEIDDCKSIELRGLINRVTDFKVFPEKKNLNSSEQQDDCPRAYKAWRSMGRRQRSGWLKVQK